MQPDVYPVDLVESRGGRIAIIERRERWALEQRWRETFSGALRQKTGKWKYGDFDWHTFSGKFTWAEQGANAIALYLNEPIQPLVVVPESPEIVAFEFFDVGPIDFSECGTDIKVFPRDLRWTISFTHEESMNLGPYFCRSEWCGENGA